MNSSASSIAEQVDSLLDADTQLDADTDTDTGTDTDARRVRSWWTILAAECAHPMVTLPMRGLGNLDADRGGSCQTGMAECKT